VAVGTNNTDLAIAVNKIQDMCGGLVVTEKGKVIGQLPLEVAGLMSTWSIEKLNDGIEQLNHQVKTLGCEISSPFMLLSFISLPTVPEYGLSNKGLIDVRNHTLISTKF
jgi:adenine deaminase